MYEGSDSISASLGHSKSVWITYSPHSGNLRKVRLAPYYSYSVLVIDKAIYLSGVVYGCIEPRLKYADGSSNSGLAIDAGFSATFTWIACSYA